MIFQDWHLAVVLCLFFALHSSQTLCHYCANLESCLLRMCSTESTLSLIRNLIVLTCLSQPFLFCSVYIYKHATKQPLQFILVNSITLNQSNVMQDILRTGNGTALATDRLFNHTVSPFGHLDAASGANDGNDGNNAVMWDFTLKSEYVDYLFFCVPLAIMSCWSALIWTQLGKDGKLYENQTWDADIQEHVAQYEGVYCVEVLAFNVAGLATTLQGRTSLEIYYAVVACTLLMWNSLPMAYHERDAQIDNWAGLAFVLLLIIVLRNVWVHMLFSVCAGSTFVALTHSTWVSILCWVHATGGAQRASGTIVLMRTLASLMLNTANLIVFAAGWNNIC